MADTLDPALAAQLAEVFRTEAGERIAELRRLFGELAAQEGDPDQLLKSARREAHNLKGSAATVDQTQARDLALRLEKLIDTLSGGGAFPSKIALTALSAVVDQLEKSLA